jgi:hypothetical protein
VDLELTTGGRKAMAEVLLPSLRGGVDSQDISEIESSRSRAVRVDQGCQVE